MFDLKDVGLETLSKAAAIVFGLITAWRAVREMKQSREQRDRALAAEQKELRWRQARVGTEVVEKMLEDREVDDALNMIDWDSRSYKIDGQDVVVTADDLGAALVGRRGVFIRKQLFVRDVFDELFYYMGRLERMVALELTTFEDVTMPLDYYIELMARRQDVFGGYMRAFHPTALKFVERFPAWKGTLHQLPAQQAKTA
jgi:hypothetical protein